jgi:uncharacterized membrane-anchored protein YhcB (DUF1043 family)
MRFGKTLSAIAGFTTGLAVGFVFWGLPIDELQRAFAKTTAELSRTQAWLRDEIRSSEERHAQDTATLRKTQADLARTQAKLAETRERLNANAALSASPRPAMYPR